MASTLLAYNPGMNESVDVVRQLYDAFGRKDEAELRTILDPEVEWIQCAGFPGGGRRHGVASVLADVFSSLRSQWNDWRVEIEEYLDAGETVVVLGAYAGTHADTNKSMTAVFAHVYDVADGRITRFRQFTDTYELVKATQTD